MKKLVVGCMAVGLIAGCADNRLTELSFGDRLSVRLQHVSAEEGRSFYSLSARVGERCRDADVQSTRDLQSAADEPVSDARPRETKIALVLQDGTPRGFTLKGTTPRRTNC
jgi:hypothetical protein